jgi:hypothetical protein
LGLFLRSARVAVAFAGAAIAGAAGCGPSRAELPAPPVDLQALAAQYDQPTGTVPAQAMNAIADLDQTLAVLSDSRLIDVVGEALAGLRQRLRDTGFEIDPARAPDRHTPAFDASVRIDRTCRGWDPSQTTPDQATNGTVELFGEIRDSLLQRNVWGTASKCRGRIDVGQDATVKAGVHAYLDGTIGVYLQAAVPENGTQAQLVLAWSGTLGSEQATAHLTFDFRVVPPQIEVRVPVPDGHVIGSVGANEISLRGRNGTFGCARDTETCGPIVVVHDAP